MKFKKILKRKVYPTWVSITKVKGYKTYIMLMGKYYHFQLFSEGKEYYSSLEDNIKFKDFEECCKAAEQWIRNEIIN